MTKRLGRPSPAILAGATLAFGSLAIAPVAGAQGPATPGTEELFNLEHVYNFDPQDHEPGHPWVGSDLEFFTHTVPLRDYGTGAFVDGNGNRLPEGASPVMAERDFSVMGSFQRGGYVFDITDPEKPQFVTQVTCRQDRNDVAITKMQDENGSTRVLLALTQQTGNPCADAGAVGLIVNEPAELQGFHEGVQWGDTAEVDGQTGKLVYAGTGCSAASYADVADQIAGNIALVDDRVSATNEADQCPAYTFFQKVRTAQEAGAIGFVQITEEGEEPNGAVTAVAADIPAIEVRHTDDIIAVRDAVIDGTSVDATIGNGPEKSTLVGDGSGGVGVFDITDPYNWKPMYRLLTGHGGVHNFVFHPTQPYGYASNGALPGGINEIPIVDFSDLDKPKVLRGPQTEGGVHDVEFSPDGTRAYAASENNYRIYDTTEPWRPELVSRTPNVGTYAHGVFPTSDRSLMVTNNESLTHGGFLGPGSCPGEGLASYDITDEEAPAGPLGYYTPQVYGPVAVPEVTDERPCTSHFGRFAPGTKVMSIGWYIAGTRVVDWSDPSNPKEIAGAVLEGTNTWAAKFYKGPYVYAGDIGRGFDVFRWSGEGPAPWAPDDDVPRPSPTPSPTSEPTPSPAPEPQPSESPAPEPSDGPPPVEPGCTADWCRIRPGALISDKEEATFCTMGFVFRDRDTGRLLVSTAAHCTEKVGQRFHAEEEEESFQTQEEPFGTVVFRGDPDEVGRDYALIEIDEGREGDVSISVRVFGGPEGVAGSDQTAPGDEVMFYGYGTVFDFTPDLRPRRGELTAHDEAEFWMDGLVMFGDSGAPVLHESGNALGLISVIAVSGQGVSAGPTVEGMLDFLAGAGHNLVLLQANFTEAATPPALPVRVPSLPALPDLL